MLYLAYGSNLKIEQMNFRCPSAVIHGTAYLKDWKLMFKGNDKDKYYLTIEPSEGDVVPLAVWDVTDEDEKSLDKYERFPRFYYKQDLEVECNGETIRGFAYIMTEGNAYGLPEQEYIDRCSIGYSDFKFDISYFNQALADSKEAMDLRKTAIRP